MAQKKIVILGGGISALTTAFYLTNTPNWQEHYDITLYTMGWRLGGKVASSRNVKKNGRIEDTGIHFCPGFYENTFRMVRDAFEEMTGSPDVWRAEFLKQNTLSAMEADSKGGWYPPWITNFSPNDRNPGDGLPDLQLWEHFVLHVLRVMRHHTNVVEQYRQAEKDAGNQPGLFKRIWNAIVGFFTHTATEQLTLLMERLEELFGRTDLLDKAEIEVLELISELAGLAVGLLEKIIEDLEKPIDPYIESHINLRRDWILLQLGLTVAKGILEDRILFEGFGVIDKYDFREWLEKHGAKPDVSWCVQVQGIYEGLFAFPNGNLDTPNLSAGAALYGAFRWFFTYSGAVVWRMRESTGVAIFSPLYRVLKQRGVKFEFFHRVHSLNLPQSGDKNTIASITMGRQVDLKQNEYEPLLPREIDPFTPYTPQYWPVEPLYDQINDQQAKELQAAGVDLERYSSAQVWPDRQVFTLEAGTDFDYVVMGIPIGAIPCVCPDFGAVNPKWTTMLQAGVTVKTQAFQLWLTPTTAELGWTGPSDPIVSTYERPYRDWGNMNQLINPVERADGINTVAHFAVVLPDDVANVPPCDLSPDDHQQAEDYVNTTAKSWLSSKISYLWPDATDPNNPQGLDWSTLYVFDDKLKGEERFNDQYWRANIDPSIRYDLTVKDSIQHRLRPDESGFDNLIVCGSWTNNGLNISLMEGAVMSGMLATRAVSKRVTSEAYPPFDAIVGYLDIVPDAKD